MTELEASSGDLKSLEISEHSTSVNHLIRDKFFKGAQIYIQGLLAWRIWLHMATSEIRRRYRRTLLGPFWATLSVAIFIGTMGIVFPRLWHMDVKTFLPFFSSGFIIWSFVSILITESCGTYIDVTGLIKQMPLPCSVYSNLVVARNVLILLHHLIVYVAVMIIFHVPVNLNTLFVIPAIVILCITASWVTILFGLVSARFRDVKQIVVSFLQIALFVTPILWTPAQLGTSWQAKWLVNANPLFHFVAIGRAPLLGQAPSLMNWAVSISVCIIGWILTMRILNKYYRHIVFWL